MIYNNISTIYEILKDINNWSARKKSIFNNPKHIDIAINHIAKNLIYAPR